MNNLLLLLPAGEILKEGMIWSLFNIIIIDIIYM